GAGDGRRRRSLPGRPRGRRRRDRRGRRARGRLPRRRREARARGGGAVLREARGDAVIRIAHEVREAEHVVALETTLVAHGFPPGEGVAVGLASEAAVRDGGAVPATVGVPDGEIVVGPTPPERERVRAS